MDSDAARSPNDPSNRHKQAFLAACYRYFMLRFRRDFPLLKDSLAFRQTRHKHQNAHRTIAVKLLEDIPGVGEKSSIQSVAPGRMRHVFYPRKQAAYITERPRKDASTKLPQQPRTELSDIRDRLSSLEPLVFQRAIYISSNTSIVAESHKLKGPVTSHDVIQRLGRRIGIDIAPLSAGIDFRNSAATDRVDSTGEYHVLVHLSTGDIFPVKVLIEPKLDTLESRVAS